MNAYLNICIASSFKRFLHRRWWNVEASWPRTYRSFHCHPYQRIQRGQPFQTEIDMKIHVIHTCIMEKKRLIMKQHTIYIHNPICKIIHSNIYVCMHVYIHFLTYFKNFNSLSKKKHSSITISSNSIGVRRFKNSSGHLKPSTTILFREK